MLSKLIKYEFKATGRIFLLTYVVVVALAGVNAAMLAVRPPSNSGLEVLYAGVSTVTGLLYGIAAFAAFLLTIVIVVVRFYRMLGDEGYLWFTLPVTPTQQIFGKLIPATVWTIVTTIVTLASVGLVTFRANWPSLLGSTWRSLASQGFNPGVWLVCGLVFILFSLLVNVMLFYAAIAWGPNLIKSSRLGGSVVAYIIIYVALEVINLVGVLVMVLMFANTFKATQTIPSVLTSADVAAINHAGAVFGTYFGIEYLILAVIGFFITRHFIGRKLNLS
ncbi:MAG: hypothetical protein FWF36_07520 [Propionibacteriaceae bacterium]|nr:hypothetical protein [Propionibacteriaceae bacterium]